MNKIANRAVMCEVLMEKAALDKDVVVLCCDSRGSGSMTPYAEIYPEQFIEIGIAEQNLVSISAGLASCGKKPYAVSPASFISTRSYEQAKVDCAYSRTNVKLVGISGGVSYGALGMTHHSAQDIAAMSAIPGMRVYLPSDRFQTRKLFEALIEDKEPAYIRMGRNPVEDVYTEGELDDIPGREVTAEPGRSACGKRFEMNRAIWLKKGSDIAIIACGEMVLAADKAAGILAGQGVSASVIDMYCVKPLDREAAIEAAENSRAVLTVEEHSPYGGLGSMVAQAVSEFCPRKVKCLSLPDAPVITGTSQEVFKYYGLDGEGIAATAMEILQQQP